eukprot:6872344-Prorocentrum_lima.AAC.1
MPRRREYAFPNGGRGRHGDRSLYGPDRSADWSVGDAGKRSCDACTTLVKSACDGPCTSQGRR